MELERRLDERHGEGDEDEKKTPQELGERCLKRRWAKVERDALPNRTAEHDE